MESTENKNKIINKNMKNITKKVLTKKTCQGACRGIWRILVVIFILVSIFYGLVWIPSQQLKISQDELKMSVAAFNFNNELAQLNLTKIRNSCELAAQNSLANYEAKAGKMEESEKVKMLNSLFTNCLFAEGINIQNKDTQKEKTAEKQPATK